MTSATTRNTAGRPLVLASTSPYRRELLARLGLPFQCVAPQTNEAALPGELPHATARRLAEAKAQSAAATYAGALIIASDQVADLAGQPINKPLTHERALEQLLRMQGKRVDFHTGLALLDVASGRCQVDVVTTVVTFRFLPRAALENYLRREQPYDCAGAAKIEALGITLAEKVESDDPTALIGLPLIRLTGMLLAENVAVL
jgi:septum formation protein